MPDDTPLTLEGALSFMRVDPNAPAPVEDQNKAAPGTDPAADTDPNPAEGDAPAQQAASEANTDTPQSDEGETNADQADPGDALPPIEPPASWSTEEKAEWPNLSRKAQEVILRREQDGTKALRQAQNSSAEGNKKLEAEVTRLKAVADQIDGYLNEKVADLAREFPEIKSEADLVALAASDPAKAQLFQVKVAALASQHQAKTAAQRELAQKAEQAQQENLLKAKDALLEAFPGWKDVEVARRESTELQDYAIKTFGVPEAAARATLDPAIYKMAQKAMLYDKAQDAAKAALKRTPPRTVPPGARNSDPGQTQKEETRRSRLDKLSNSGDIDDARGLLRA